MNNIFIIRRYGALSHSSVHIETRRKLAAVKPEREIENRNGPVIVTVRDGRILPKPEVIEVKKAS